MADSYKGYDLFNGLGEDKSLQAWNRACTSIVVLADNSKEDLRAYLKSISKPGLAAMAVVMSLIKSVGVDEARKQMLKADSVAVH